MRRPSPAAWAVIVLVLLSLPIIFYRLGSYSLVNGDEAVYHLMAQNMVETGNWFRLECLGKHRVYDTFMNAPIHYWARATLITAFGANYWTMRILSAVFGLLTVLMSFRLASYMAGVRAGFLAGLILLTLYQFIYLHSARTGELETMVCFLFVLAVYLFLRSLESGRSFLAHHLCVVALMNLKLPLTIVMVAAELAWFATSGKQQRRHIRGWLAAAWILPLGLSWHVAQALTLGVDTLEVAERMAGQASGTVSRRDLSRWGNVVSYGKTLVFGAFPWILAFPMAVAGLAAGPSNESEKSRLRLILCYVAAVFVFYLLVTKSYPWYIIPVYPFLAVCLGIWLARLHETRYEHWVILGSSVLLTLLVWLRIGTENPFIRPLRAFPDHDMAWRSLAGLGPGLGLPLTLLLTALALYAARALLRAGFPRLLAYILILALVGYGALRAVLPLRHTGHRSEMEQLKEQLASKRSAGEALVLPIPVHQPGFIHVHFYFGDDFQIRPGFKRGGTHFWLVLDKREGKASSPR